MKQKITNILKIMLIATYVSYYAGSVLFLHSHIIDGKQVMHSHPYLPSSNHSHSTAVFGAINQLNNIVFICGLIIAFFALKPRVVATIKSRQLILSSHYLALSSPLRGPPAC